MKKRFFSFFLVLCMALSLLPFGTAAAEIVKEGVFGEGLEWKLYSSGLLTINGTGSMYAGNRAWIRSPFEDNEQIQEVVIGNGVRDIGESAFNSCTNLKKVTIPESVVSIKSFAFAGCTSLESVTIPSATTFIGLYKTFYQCSSLTAIHVAAGNSNYSSKDGVLFNKDQTELLCCPGGKTGEYTIPDGVESVLSRAFAFCAGLTEVIVPGSVKSIGDEAFMSCTGLKNVTIAEGVESIGSGAFSSCAELKELKIPASVTEIGSEAFLRCNCTFSVADNNVSFSSLDGVLYNKNHTELLCYAADHDYFSFEIPEGVTTIGENAFYGKWLLENLTIPVSVTRIENNAFNGYHTLKVNYRGTREQWNAISRGYGNERLFRDVHCIDDPDPTPPTPTTPTTEDPDLDTDGDGLYDVWEINGLDYNGDGEVDIDLPKMGADPNKVDIFVEIDWMTGCKPSSAALKTVFEQFSKHNINLHLDAGEDSIDYVTGKAWDQLSGGNEIPFEKSFDLGKDYDEWIAEVRKNMDSARQLCFKHCFFINRFKKGLISSSNTGLANDIPGQMFLVCDIDGFLSESNTAVAGTFMHELGHTLGLRHGGDDNLNYKPNYLSVMNYYYQCSGLLGTDEINYSEFVLPEIDEKGINEERGIDPEGVINNPDIGVKWRIGRDGSLKYYINLSESKEVQDTGGKLDRIDFNQDKEYSTDLKLDINGDGRYTVLSQSINDWNHLVYKSGNIGMRPEEGIYYSEEELNNLTVSTDLTLFDEELTVETIEQEQLYDNSAAKIRPVKNPFVDVKSGAYYYDPVLWAVNHNPQITAGTSATTFSPGATCTRGQVVTFLWRAAGQPEPKSTKNPFKDVSKDAYYYKAVLWAAEQEITAGTSATTFSPSDPCTRAHVVTFLWRSEGKPTPGGKNPFQDVSQGKYYTDAVLWAVAEKITAGTSATAFSPASPCTRGQIVTFLYRDKHN